MHGGEPEKFPASAAAGCAAGHAGGLLSPMRRGAVPLGPDGLAGGKEDLRGVCRAGRRGGRERIMTLLELSVEYREHARMLDLRICQLEAVLERTRKREAAADAGAPHPYAVHHAAGGQRAGGPHGALTTRGGTAAMPNTRYRRGKLYAADMALYSMQMASDNSKEIRPPETEPDPGPPGWT